MPKKGLWSVCSCNQKVAEILFSELSKEGVGAQEE
jgi:hypothetical protein